MIQFIKDFFKKIFGKKEDWSPDKLIIEDKTDQVDDNWYYRSSPIEYLIIHEGTEKFEDFKPNIPYHFGIAPCGKAVHLISEKKYVNHSKGHDTKSLSIRLNPDYPKVNEMLMRHLKNKYPDAEVLRS